MRDLRIRAIGLLDSIVVLSWHIGVAVCPFLLLLKLVSIVATNEGSNIIVDIMPAPIPVKLPAGNNV
jgi:hypothetical protein